MLPELLCKTKASAVPIAVQGTKVIDECALLVAKWNLSCLAIYKVKARSRKDVSLVPFKQN